MNIWGITVCVNYADLLYRGLRLWQTGLDRLIVITSPRDQQTINLCRYHNIQTHITDIFYANGAKFNKGAAMSEAVIATGLRRGADWLLTFDSDIVPPEDWREQVEDAAPVPGTLYGAWRFWQPEDASPLVVDPSKRMPQGWVLGFFCLFHNSDPVLPSGALFDTHWPHAGNYDTTFTRRWPESRQEVLDLYTIHLGDERTHWLGRGRKKELRAILRKRKGHEDWERERMERPPQIG